MRIILAFLILSVLYTGSALAQIYVANSGDNTVSVVSDDPTVTVDVGLSPNALAATPDSKFVYVANIDSNNLSVIETSGNTVVATVNAFENPIDVVVTPDGASVYVVNFLCNGTVSVVDTKTNMVVGQPIEVGCFPMSVTVSPDGNFVYVSNSGNPSASNGTVSVIQTSDNTVVATVDVGLEPRGIAADPNGDFVYVVNRGSNSFSIIDTTTNMVVGSPIAVGMLPSDVVAVNQFGGLVFVSNEASHTITALQYNTQGVLMVNDTVDVGMAPTGIALSGDQSFIVTANFDSNNVSFYNFTDGGVQTASVGDSPFDVLGIELELEGPDPDSPMGQSSGKNNSCGLAGPGATNGYSLMLLFIPAIILIRRFWRRRTN